MPEPHAAVAIVRTRGPEPAILLIRRAERQGDPWSGHWSLPGGRRDPTDDGLLTTALRELEEECGIRLQPEQLSEVLPLTTARRRTGPGLLVAPFVFDIDAELPLVLDPVEAAGSAWVPLSVIQNPASHTYVNAIGHPADSWFPAIPMPGVPLWGFTYRLLADWLSIAPRGCARSGLAVARMALDFLLAHGLTLRQPWQSPRDPALVSGPIPVEELIIHLSKPGPHVPKANRLQIRPSGMEVLGLAFETYRIEAVPIG